MFLPQTAKGQFARLTEAGLLTTQGAAIVAVILGLAQAAIDLCCEIT